VPRLIHLNGPPGIGKSTLAQWYVDEHPGVLNLDIDQLRSLVGGWRDRFAETGELVRPLALGMAGTHLRAGYDVVLPQYLGRLSEIQRFARVARDADAAFCEIVLMDTREHSVQRFTDRSHAAALPWHRDVQAVVERGGGASLLGEMHDQLREILPSRPYAVVVPSHDGQIQQNYDALLANLDQCPQQCPAPPRGVAVVLDDERVLVIKRHLRGRDYAVLPGGGVEAGETAEQTAIRELHEETTLRARVERRLWHIDHGDREATYFLMRDVHGVPQLSGDEAEEHSPDNSFVLTWAAADDLALLNLYPTDIRERLAQLMHPEPVRHL
jgi:8-oxo-dGTP pyrophosphatase MutT (NUDIX family)/predicted kinase